jgi:hypothetical protein
MALVEQLDMIQTLTANRIDHTLDEPNCGRMLTAVRAIFLRSWAIMINT